MWSTPEPTETHVYKYANEVLTRIVTDHSPLWEHMPGSFFIFGDFFESFFGSVVEFFFDLIRKIVLSRLNSLGIQRYSDTSLDFRNLIPPKRK